MLLFHRSVYSNKLEQAPSSDCPLWDFDRNHFSVCAARYSESFPKPSDLLMESVPGGGGGGEAGARTCSS